MKKAKASVCAAGGAGHILRRFACRRGGPAGACWRGDMLFHRQGLLNSSGQGEVVGYFTDIPGAH